MAGGLWRRAYEGASPGAVAVHRLGGRGGVAPVPPGRRPVTASAVTPASAAAANAAVTPGRRSPRVLAATAAPPMPMPMAVPSTSARFSDAETRPSWPGGALRSIISEIGA